MCYKYVQSAPLLLSVPGVFVDTYCNTGEKPVFNIYGTQNTLSTSSGCSYSTMPQPLERPALKPKDQVQIFSCSDWACVFATRWVKQAELLPQHYSCRF